MSLHRIACGLIVVGGLGIVASGPLIGLALGWMGMILSTRPICLLLVTTRVAAAILLLVGCVLFLMARRKRGKAARRHSP